MLHTVTFTIILLCCSLFSGTLTAQLGFCDGDFGDPIFQENFGAGTSNGPSLGTTVTTYTYVNSAPQDGFYTVSSQMQQLGSFHSGLDHTPNDQNGKAFIVNASFTADQFYRRTINGLCENTSYEFSSFLQNVYNINSGACANTGIPVNVQFQIWDSTDTVLLASGDTGNINGTSTPIWTQYGLVFETSAGQNEVILKMINNGVGGCGNDLAIDDIVFRACGDRTIITSALSGEDDLILCNNQSSLSTTLTVATEPGIFIQWQTSTNGQNWSNIAGATSINFITPGLTTTIYYRVNTATEPGNLGNVTCSFFSNPYLIDFVEGPQPPQSNGDIIFCDNLELPALSVTTSQGAEIRWFASPSGTAVIATGSSFTPEETGTYYAQSFTIGTDCGSTSRTAVTVSALPSPFFNSPTETIAICDGQEVKTLSAGLTNVSYVWSTGDTSPSIEIGEAGIYTLTVTNTSGCSATKTFQVQSLELPVISNVFSEGETIVIELETEGDFEYSLDGAFYSNSPIFRNQPGGLRTVYVRNPNGCLAVTSSFYHFNIPTYFTPNNDGINDFFFLPDATFFDTSRIRVFDRFGKILISGNGANFRWDGTYGGKQLPPSDYWYVIETNESVVTGHISLLL